MSTFPVRWGMYRRTSHEVRGLKIYHSFLPHNAKLSHLTRGAWIEKNKPVVWINNSIVAPHTRCVDWKIDVKFIAYENASRTSHEVRGLKIEKWGQNDRSCSRTSHEVRGLKNTHTHTHTHIHMSHLTRGAWIETPRRGLLSGENKVAPHTRCVDWKIPAVTGLLAHNRRTSHEVRGLKTHDCVFSELYASRTSHEVRGLKKFLSLYFRYPMLVAPHTRCVDWNISLQRLPNPDAMSHLTQGAWIEIKKRRRAARGDTVAPHTRCVDWN